MIDLQSKKFDSINSYLEFIKNNSLDIGSIEYDVKSIMDNIDIKLQMAIGGRENFFYQINDFGKNDYDLLFCVLNGHTYFFLDFTEYNLYLNYSFLQHDELNEQYGIESIKYEFKSLVALFTFINYQIDLIVDKL